MPKKTLKTKKAVLKDVVPVKEKPTKKKGFLKYVFLVVLLFGALYLLKGFFIVALVNGKPVSRLALVSSLEKRYGKASLDELISKNIILSEAKSKGIKVSNQEITNEIDKIRKLVEGQGSTLEEALLTQGQTLVDLEENIKIQKTVEKLLGDSITVTDDDAKKYFEANKETFDKDTNFDEIKSDLISSLKQQKMGAEFEKWLGDKKSAAKIMYFVDFK